MISKNTAREIAQEEVVALHDKLGAYLFGKRNAKCLNLYTENGMISGNYIGQYNYGEHRYYNGNEVEDKGIIGVTVKQVEELTEAVNILTDAVADLIEDNALLKEKIAILTSKKRK